MGTLFVFLTQGILSLEHARQVVRYRHRLILKGPLEPKAKR